MKNLKSNKKILKHTFIVGALCGSLLFSVLGVIFTITDINQPHEIFMVLFIILMGALIYKVSSYGEKGK